MSERSFAPDDAKGGCKIIPSKTALVLIDFQNEFATPGGKLHDAVKEVMKSNGMLEKSAALAKKVRKLGAKVFHAPISFKRDASDNPNRKLGILGNCATQKLFTLGSWNADFCKEMKPEMGDVVVTGKKGLDAFPGTDLEELLLAHHIETVAFAGFFTNGCVESTMRTAYEKGFNVVGLKDCTATTTKEAHVAATEGTYGMFSTPMTAQEFNDELGAEYDEKELKLDD